MRTSIIIVGAFALLTHSLNAGSVTVDFGLMPSAQGWSYLGPIPQESAFSLGGGVLSQNTMGLGAGYGYYEMTNVINTNADFSLSFRGRLLLEELSLVNNSAGFAVQVGYGAQYFDVEIGAGRILSTTLNNEGVVTTTIDVSTFHDYVLTGQPASQTWQLSVDGALVASGSARQGPGAPPNSIMWGDITAGPNAKGEWTQLSFAQIPEPSTLALIGLGCVAVVVRSSSKRR